MMCAAAVGHRSGRATPSLRDAPQQQSMEIVGRETIYRNRNAVQTNPATSVAYSLVPGTLQFVDVVLFGSPIIGVVLAGPPHLETVNFIAG